MNNLSVVAAIELDDKSHNAAKRIARDKFLNAAFEAAGLPLIRFKAQKSYVTSEISMSLKQSIDFNEDALSEVSKTKETSLLTVQKALYVKPEVKEKEGKSCPKCSSRMVQKKASKGKYAGNIFLACSAYPKCKTILPLEDAT